MIIKKINHINKTLINLDVDTVINIQNLACLGESLSNAWATFEAQFIETISSTEADSSLQWCYLGHPFSQFSSK